MGPAGNCHRKWQRTTVRKASWSRASNSPAPGEGRSLNGPADEEDGLRLRHLRRLLFRSIHGGVEESTTAVAVLAGFAKIELLLWKRDGHT